MRRPLLAALAVLALAAAPAAAFTPLHGFYSGKDDRGREVNFSYTGHHLHDFTLAATKHGHRAYVSTHNWHFHNRHHYHDLYGHWTDEHRVTGVFGYYRRTSRGPVHVAIHWTAQVVGQL